MFNTVFLNFFLIIFLGLVVGENEIKPKIPELKVVRKKINSLKIKTLAEFLVLLLYYIALPIFKGMQNPLQIYIFLAFSFTLVFHAMWITWKLERQYKVAAIALAILISTCRILFPNVLTHNLFIFFIPMWYGPLFTSLKWFSRKIFISLSLIWAAYDIFYVWLSSLHTQVSVMSESARFPLAMVSGYQSIGLADLLWASLFLSVLKNRKQRIYGGMLLVLSNLGLDFVGRTTNFFSVFPLLVLWVPLGLAFMALHPDRSPEA